MKCELQEGKPRKLVCVLDRDQKYIVAFIKRRKTNKISVEYRFKNSETKEFKFKTFDLSDGELPQDWVISEKDKRRLLKRLVILNEKVLKKKTSRKALRKQIKELAIEVGKVNGIDVKDILRERNKERNNMKDWLKQTRS